MVDEQREIRPIAPLDQRPTRSIAVNVLAYDLVDIIWWSLGFFLFSTWICLIVVLLSHIVSSHDLSGWGKAFWLVCLMAVPVIGALAFVIVRRGKITKRQPEVRGQNVAVPCRPTPAVDAARLDELHDRGLLTDEEYVRQRMRALS
jgi:hypothetical protein